ncbi:hypothetical protein VTN77DRAFT_9 [Rasamsonia byssochlamydoides]|uniref:uncharacterized protein n=1 Tax=Rasamsonia byssochlamydoides TaxID=89139 RepID=UPI0037424B3F
MDWSDSVAYDFEQDREPTAAASDPRSAPASYRTKRPHKKSRAGCFSCKARRVKCQETLPTCDNCKNKQLPCVYPSKAEQHLVRRRGGRKPASTGNCYSPSSDIDNLIHSVPTATSSTFTADDLRFFHQFLSVAYPHLPFGSDQAWLMNVPMYAHYSPPLMHAILSLGATHLTLVAPRGRDYTAAAILHRGKALRGLNEMLEKEDCTCQELSTMLATCFALTFQAHYMPDGLLDFAVMVRGCALISGRLRERYSNSTIFDMRHEKHKLYVMEKTKTLPMLDVNVLHRYLETLELVQPLLQDEAHHQFYGALVDTLNALRQSSPLGYMEFARVYEVWKNMGHREFLAFISEDNAVSQILLFHFVAFHVILSPILIRVVPQRVVQFPQAILAIFQWGERIYQNIPPIMRGYVQWQVDLIAFAKTTIADEGLAALASEFIAKQPDSFETNLEESTASENHAFGRTEQHTEVAGYLESLSQGCN